MYFYKWKMVHKKALNKHMTPTEYIKESARTESKKDFPTFSPDLYMQILHGTMGIVTESGELLDSIKKHLFYGKQLDIVNISEEIGDILWYIALLCRVFNLTFEELMETNIEKLKIRFPEKFTEERANNRDLEKERTLLEEFSLQ